MRAAKGSKKEAVWSIFGVSSAGSPNQTKKSKSKSKSKNPKFKKVESTNSDKKTKLGILIPKEGNLKESPTATDSKGKDKRSSSKKSRKKESDGMSSPRSTEKSASSAIHTNSERKLNSEIAQPRSPREKNSKIDLTPALSPRSISNGSPPVPKIVKISNLDLSNLNSDATCNSNEQLVQTVSLLESKMISLTNINCALQSQIDEMISAYNKLKNERDEIRRDRDAVVQELEIFKTEKKRRIKKKRNSNGIQQNYEKRNGWVLGNLSSFTHTS